MFFLFFFYRTFSSGRGLIRKIRFSPADKLRLILVLFADGDFGTWDLDNSVRMSVSSFLRARGLKALDTEWISDHNPVLGMTMAMTCVRACV